MGAFLGALLICYALWLWVEDIDTKLGRIADALEKRRNKKPLVRL